MPWKPAGYTSASPYLLVRDANETLRFGKAVFDATPLRVIPCDDGPGIMHAEMRIDDTVVMMGEMSEPHTANVHVYVADAEAVFERALQEGATLVQKLTRAGDGDYRGGVDDGNGAIWWISQMEDASAG